MIRLATQQDSSRIAEIDVFTCRFAYKDIVNDEILYRNTLVKDRIQNVKKWINTDGYVYVYEDEDKIIKGVMGIAKCEDDDKRNAYELHFLYVEPIFSRNGIGTELIKFFEEKGISLGYKEFIIWVLEENNIGRRFYDKNKYNIDGSEKIFERFNKKEIRYIKLLT